MSILNQIWELIDLYGFPIYLRYDRKPEYNTISSIIFSILTIISTIIVLLYYVTRLFQHKNFTIIHNSEQLYEKKILNFTRIPILIGFVNDGGRPVTIDPKYLSITLDKNDHYPDKDKEGVMYLRRESKSIKLEYCDINKHFNNDSYIIGMIDDFEYQNYLCAVPGQNLSIAGRYGDSIHGYDILEIHLIKCDNNSNNSSCASEEELNQFYKNSYLSILYLSEALNHYDYKNPIRKTFRSEVFMVVSNSVKRYYYYFAPGEYISYNGYLFMKAEKYKFFEYRKTDLDFVDEEDQSYYSNATLIEVALSSMDLFVSYSRKYEKIQDCFGSIAGWIRIIYTIAKGIADYFSNKIFLLKVVNNIFIPSNNINNNTQKTSFFNSNFKSEFENNENKRNNSNIGNSESSKNKIISTRFSNKKLFNNNEGFKSNNNLNNFVSNLQNNTQETLNFNNHKKKFSFNCCQYFLPIFILKREVKFRNLFFYENFIYKNISIEVIIPLIERISRSNYEKEIINKKTGNYFSKMNSTILNNNYLKKPN